MSNPELKSEDYCTRKDTIEGWEVNITSYRVGETHYSRVDNVSPGATVARGEGKSRDEAETEALRKARERLAATRRRPPSP
jgi:dsRNA-specific ribonuclease